MNASRAHSDRRREIIGRIDRARRLRFEDAAPAVASRFRPQNAVLALPAPKPSPIGRDPTSYRPLFRSQAMPRRSLTTQVRQRAG